MCCLACVRGWVSWGFDRLYTLVWEVDAECFGQGVGAGGVVTLCSSLENRSVCIIPLTEEGGGALTLPNRLAENMVVSVR
jgi:hypothetical protein